MSRIFAFLCLVLLFAGAAYANTFVFINENPTSNPQVERLVSSTPGANQSLEKAPSAVIINFSNPIKPDKSSIKVYDLYGTEITDGNVTVNGAAMSVNLPPLTAGRYAVKWKARCLCDDDSDLHDEFHFTVR